MIIRVLHKIFKRQKKFKDIDFLNIYGNDTFTDSKNG